MRRPYVLWGKIDKQIPREDFAAVAELVFAAVKESRENDVMSPDGVEEFLDEVAIYDLEAKTDDRTDFYVAFYGIEAPLVGFAFVPVWGLCSRCWMEGVPPI